LKDSLYVFLRFTQKFARSLKSFINYSFLDANNTTIGAIPFSSGIIRNQVCMWRVDTHSGVM